MYTCDDGSDLKGLIVGIDMKQVDILISKNQELQILYLKHHAYNFI